MLGAVPGRAMNAENVLAAAGVCLVMAAPTVSLLLLRRWLRRWWAALACVVLALPPVAFVAVGGVAWALTNHEVVIAGDTSVPDENGQPVPQYLGFIFAICGSYGVLFAATGFALGLPLVAAWRLAHPASFNRFIRSA
jgi:hypothetical protein